MSVKKVDGNLKEGKTPEAMNSNELEDLISLQSTVIPVDANGNRIEEVKEEPKEKDVQPKEKASEEKPKETKEVKEELILGKFKSQEDLIKSYQESEKKISQQGEEVARERKLRQDHERILSQIYDFDELGTPVPKRQAPPQGQDPLAILKVRYPGWEDEQLIPILEISGAIANQALRNYAETQKKELEPLYEIKFEKDVEKQKNRIRKEYPDYAEFESEVNDKLSTLPPTLRAKEGSVETIFLTVRGMHTPELLSKAREEAQKQTETIEKKKEDAFVEGGGKASVPTPPINIRKMSSAQMEELIKQHPEYGRKK